MPRTISEGFTDFLSTLTPSSTETEAAKSHRASIMACLKNNFGVQRFFRTGSFGNGTSISGYSDVDYFTSIPAQHQRQNSTTMLTTVRNALDTRFPLTGVRVDCPAVKVPFGRVPQESTEVVPAYAIATQNNSVIYHIPDCSGGWMRSSPELHNGYVQYVDQQKGEKVKSLIRFIKAWKYYRQVPISSFYLELRVAKYASEETAIVYDIDVKRIFALLSRIELASIQDPMNISGYIPACSSQVQLEDAKVKLRTALSRAEKAVDANQRGKTAEAFDWWRLVYDNCFPTYYR